ncbi:hypothetical protein IGI39_004650 [Enterococcus sp. AZ135]|uniref:MerR family transcriptional regulator n=1 Tax=unclassified Enterococcus TaxID=2608891 RepID=UPI003F1F6104
MDRKNLLSIGEVSKLFDVHIKSLRYYEEIGVFKPHYVDPNNHYRYYSYQQLSVLEAIKTCIELDIPLKKFEAFTENEGTVVNFAGILEYGKKRALEKINIINDSLLSIETIQTEIENSMRLPTNGQAVITEVPRSYYFIKPFEETFSLDDYYEEFVDLFQEAKNWGYKTGYDMGKLYIFQAQAIKKFNFIQVIDPANSKYILTIPSGERIEKCVTDSRIDYAADEFPDLFSDDRTKIVLESELISSTYNTEQPPFKLSCSKNVPETIGSL